MTSIPSFDPYHKWLGISAAEQPPNHYRLLGINIFESDADVIEAAADQRMAHLRTFQNGPHSALSQRLLNEVAVVKACLLTATKKAAYDADINDRIPRAVPIGKAIIKEVSDTVQAPKVSRTSGEMTADLHESALGEILTFASPSRRSDRKKRTNPYPAIGVAVVAVVAAAAVTAVAVISRNREEENIIERLPSPIASLQPAPPPTAPAPAEPARTVKPPAGEPVGHHRDEPAAKPEPDKFPTANDSVNSNRSETTDDPSDESADDASSVPRSSEGQFVTDRPDSTHVKLPTPSEMAQKDSLAVIKNVYKEDYAKAKSPQQKLDLAKKLLQEGVQTEGDPVGKFVLLRVSRDLAVQTGDISVAMHAVDQISTTYDVDPLEMKSSVLSKLSKSVSTPPAQRELAQAIEQLIDVAIDEDNYSIAQQLAGSAITVSRNTKDAALLKKAVARSKEIEQNAVAFAETQKALKVLDEKPIDPDANLTVGKFRCFNRRDWENGLPLLAIGSDPTLKGVAEKEATPPSKASDQVALGDEWWAIAEKKTGITKTSVQSRAVHWYEQALPNLSGLPKARIEKRMGEHQQAVPASAAIRNPWEQFRLTPGGTSLMDGFVHIRQGKAGLDEVNEVRSKDGYAGGIEITVIARTDKNNIRIAGPQGSKVIFNWESNPRELRVHRPNGGGIATAVFTPLTAGKWHTLQMRVTDKGLEIRVDGKVVFSEARHYDLGTKSTVAVMSYDSDIDVKSFVVTRLPGSKTVRPGL